MNHGGGVLYNNIFYGITDRTQNNIFLGGGIKFRQYINDFAPKFLKIPPYFSTSVGKCASDHGCIGFAAFVGKSVGNCADRQAV